MERKPIIAVVGHDRHAQEKHIKAAEEVGREIAKMGGIVVCGGKNQGVANAAAKGAEAAGGVSVGILPGNDNSETSSHITVPVVTGVGFARNQILGLTADAIIAVGGGVGAFTEIAYAYAYSKPIVVLAGMGGIPEKYIGQFLDDKKTVKILGADSAKEAVELAFSLVKKR